MEEALMATSPTSSEPVRSLNAVYDWASKLTAESRGVLWVVDYYWPAAVKKLHDRLLHSQRELIAVLGSQGVGKTSAMQALELRLNREIYLDALETVRKQEKKTLRESQPKAIALNLSDLEAFLNFQRPIESYGFYHFQEAYTKEVNEILRFRRIRMPYDSQVSLTDAEAILGKTNCRTARMRSVLNTIPRYPNILLDLPDYSKTDRRCIVQDLDQIQILWRSAVQDPQAKTNFVFFMQEDAFRDHFFFGKMDTVIIEPLKAQDLVSAYKKKFKDAYPFTEEALLHVAKLSRGIFRRFLTYIKLCLDKHSTSESHPELVEKDLVHNAISSDQLAEDRSAELSQLFPKNAEARKISVDILDLLEEKKNMNQKAIAEHLEIPEYKFSRIIGRLESARHIQRQEKGRDKIVRLTELT